MKSLIFLLIPLIYTIFPSVTFANTSKDTACNYKEGVYRESLEVIGLKRASVSEFHKRDYYDHSELWYVVRQSNMYSVGKTRYDDYSIYSYNCKTKKPYRVIWQMTLRKVVAKIPSNHIFSDARIAFIGGKYITLNWYPDGIGCSTDSCNPGFYTSSIDYSPHTFTIAKRIPERGPNEYDIVGNYTY